jgi:hypothetical protein
MPAAADLLEIWERVQRCGPQERALHLLAWALPDQKFDGLADFDLGLRDWHLLRLRRAIFGSTLAGYTDCPHCGERLEIELDARTLQDDTPLPQAPQYVCRDGRRFRLPNSHDLIAIADVHDAEAAARELFERCSLDSSKTKDSATFEEVDNGLATLAAERSVQFELNCAACDESWQLTFDPGMFLWEEIEARVIALLDDVHRIASAYGWSESEILALGDTRRAAYLSRVN